MDKSLIFKLLPQFQRAGETLLACRCNNSHSGNLSIRVGGGVVITRTGAMLGCLNADDLIVTGMRPTETERRRASTELSVHLGIYERSNHVAIAHGHALSAVTVAWLTDCIRPIDVEGAYYFGGIPVLEHVPATADPTLGAAIGNILANAPVVVLRGHGVFAGGETLERAMQRITSVNDSAELILKARSAGLDVGALASKAYLQFDQRDCPYC